jgi:hypothetical protein
MPDLLEDIVTYFMTNGLVQGDGIDTYRDTAPDIGDSLVVVYEYEGDPLVPQIASANRSIQVVAIDKSATAAKNKARLLQNSLLTDNGILNLTPTRWCMPVIRNVPVKIKVDAQKRIHYGFNVGITTYND